MYLALFIFAIYKKFFNISVIENLFMDDLTIIYIGTIY